MESNQASIAKKRYYFLDELRGLALLAMVFTHSIYSITFVVPFPVSMKWYGATLIINPMIQLVFILLCGVSCQLSRNNLKRGMILAGCALVVSAVTLVFLPEQSILFGILHMLAVCVLLFHFTERQLGKLPPLLVFFISLFLFIITLPIQNGYIGIEGFIAWRLPEVLYSTSWLFPLGFIGKSFFSADYFPLLPWYFLFICGTMIGRYAKEDKLPLWMAKNHLPILAWVGRHTLIIYMLHQPIIFGILSAIQLVIK